MAVAVTTWKQSKSGEVHERRHWFLWTAAAAAAAMLVQKSSGYRRHADETCDTLETCAVVLASFKVCSAHGCVGVSAGLQTPKVQTEYVREQKNDADKECAYPPMVASRSR